jgi:enamine deaminase RidA (YjgF/YER057c/UK114 family)
MISRVLNRCTWVAVLSLSSLACFAQVRYIIPSEFPDLPYSYGVAFAKEIDTISINATAKGTTFRNSGIKADGEVPKSLKEQMQKALVNFDGALRELHSSKMDVARLSVKFVGDSMETTEMLSDELEKFFLLRTVSREKVLPPVRSMVGVSKLSDPNLLVEFQATVFDPKSKPEALQGRGIDVPETFGQNGEMLLVGGVTALQKNYLTRGVQNMRTQMRESLKNLEVVLAKAGAERSDVRNLKVFYVPAKAKDLKASNKTAQEVLNQELKSFFGDNQPTILAVAAEAACAEQLNVLLEADAVVKPGAKVASNRGIATLARR